MDYDARAFTMDGGGGQTPAVVMPRALKPPSEDLSLSDYLRSLPPRL